MASKSLADLQPHFAKKAELFKKRCADAGIDVLIYCTLRSSKEQDVIYAHGRTLPGRIATNARGGQSMHNYGLAFDFVPMLGGKPMWSDSKAYEKLGVIGESCGMVWSGRWTGKLKETAHFQDSEVKWQALQKQFPQGWTPIKKV